MTKTILLVSLLFLSSGVNQIMGQWEQLNVPTPGTDDLIISVLDLGDKLFVGSYGGTFKSTDEGLTWTSLTNNGIPESARIYYFAVLGNTIIATSSIPIGIYAGVYRSSDRGETWQRSNSGLGNDSINTRTVYKYNGKFYLGVGSTSSASAALYYSTDDGVSWEVRNNGISVTEKRVEEFASVGQNLFASVDFTGGGALYKSSDDGGSWTSISPPGIGRTYSMVGHTPYLIAYFFELYRSSTFLPFDSSWVLIVNGLPQNPEINSMDADLNNIYAAVYENGAYKSSDFGDNWTVMNDGLPAGAEIYIIYRGANYIYAGTVENNLLRYPLNTSGLSDENIIISDFSLNQNYPNPFNPSTTINFSIPEASYVSLKIFNSLGEAVKTLVAEELSSGNYKNDWNAINLPSGIYFYKLQTENFVETKKMILMK